MRTNNNFIHVSGTVVNLPDTVKYIPEPLIAFDLECHRRPTEKRPEPKPDVFRMVLMNDEEFIDTFQDGDRMEFKGEIQSRNFTIEDKTLNEIFQYSVDNYHILTGELPILGESGVNKKRPLDWRKLEKYNLIPYIPEDSMYDIEMNKHKSKESPYVYLVDSSGKVTKETEHVRYEILIKSYKKLDEPMDEALGDRNYVDMTGKVSKEPLFNLVGNGVPFTTVNIGTSSEILKGYHYFNNAIAWNDNATYILDEVQKGDIIRVKGRFQSHPITKTLRMKKVTASGNKKTKKTDIELLVHEISCFHVEKLKK